ncbi:conserved hypothetical protein (plasmid) [Pseudarthrobacter chlorophenolicus A6]|uniref:Lipoprotein n=2 Tax=Pseudarthrobacter chlorophenolicus TaxID=85085 RepID=B8HIX2_PSECP|nr:conserved hypothetical protein [Pseudarthrobacter chlorophenolicus A6]
MDHPGKVQVPSAHIRPMSNARKTLSAVAAAAAILTAATGCSAGIEPVGGVVSKEDREAYETAHFLTPEGKASADQELAKITGKAAEDRSSAAYVNDVLLRPADWPELAHGKLCEYTAALIGDADRDGTAVPEKARAAANRILADC